jgi:hypothetical protein
VFAEKVFQIRMCPKQARVSQVLKLKHQAGASVF